MMKSKKVPIRFFDNNEVRAIWNDENSKWRFSVVDIIGVLTESSDPRNYWKYFKTKLKKENSQLVSNTNQFKLIAQDGKKRLFNSTEE